MVSSSWRMELVLKALSSSITSNKSLFRTEGSLSLIAGKIVQTKLSVFFERCFG